MSEMNPAVKKAYFQPKDNPIEVNNIGIKPIPMHPADSCNPKALVLDLMNLVIEDNPTGWYMPVPIPSIANEKTNIIWLCEM